MTPLHEQNPADRIVLHVDSGKWSYRCDCGREGHPTEKRRALQAVKQHIRSHGSDSPWKGNGAAPNPVPADLAERFPSITWGEREWVAVFDAWPGLVDRILDGIAAVPVRGHRYGKLVVA